MSKFKFINIIDAIFLTIATLLIIFAWLQYFLKNIVLSLLLSLIISIAIIMLVRFFYNKKYKAKQNALTFNKELTSFKLAIQTMSNTKLISLIKKLVPPSCTTSTKKGDIYFTKNGISNIITFYYSAELTDTKLLDILKNKSAENITIFCSSYTKEAKFISSAFKDRKITLINLEQLFEIFNQKNIKINTTNIDLTTNKVSLKEILKASISKEKSKGYFISGLILLFTSIIIPYKVYYVVISTILISLSLICRLRPHVKVKTNLFD